MKRVFSTLMHSSSRGKRIEASILYFDAFIFQGLNWRAGISSCLIHVDPQNITIALGSTYMYMYIRIHVCVALINTCKC